MDKLEEAMRFISEGKFGNAIGVLEELVSKNESDTDLLHVIFQNN